MFRSALAFLVSPFPAALVQSIVVASWPKKGMGVFENPPSMFVAVCIYFYFFGLLIGAPASMVMRRRKPVDLRAYAIIGLIVGLLPVCAALGWMIIRTGASTYVVAYNLLFFGLGGMAAGLCFWMIVRRSRQKAPEQAKA